jgi:hypothetical protein
MRKSAELAFDNDKKSWILTPANDKYSLMKSALPEELRRDINIRKEYLRKRFNEEPALVEAVSKNKYDWMAAIEALDWPNPDKITIRERFIDNPSSFQQIRGYEAATGVYLGNNLLLSCGHGLEKLAATPEDYVAIFTWVSDLTHGLSEWAVASVEK